MTKSSQTSSSFPRVVVTTSWDDEDRTGLKLAELLQAHGIRGTFYVPTGRLGQGNAFSVADLRSLAAGGFEIGAHTVTHPILTEINGSQLLFEVGHCKEQLEQALGEEVSTFCYPRGRFNNAVRAAVQDAGYRGARGTLMLCTRKRFSPFAIPTTLQAYPHRRENYLRNLMRERAVATFVSRVPQLLRYENWLQLGKSTFDRVLPRGGVWHLYGHPWELERLNLWGDLEKLLRYIGRRREVCYTTNAALIEMLPARERHAEVKENRAAPTPY